MNENNLLDFYQNFTKTLQGSFVDKGIVYASPNLSWSTYERLAVNPILKKLVLITPRLSQSKWLGYSLQNFSISQENEKVSREIYDIVEEVLDKLMSQMISMRCTYGNSFCLVSDLKPKMYTLICLISIGTSTNRFIQKLL